MKVGQPYSPYGLFTGIFIPEVLLHSDLVSLGAKVLYGRLARYAGKDGKCFPKIKTLGAELRIGESQTKRYLSELLAARLIERLERYTDETRAERTSNEYVFLWHPLLEQQMEDSITRTQVGPDMDPPPSGYEPTSIKNYGITPINPRDYGDGQVPKRVIEESQLNINNRDDVVSGIPPRLLTEEEWPLTTTRVRKRFFSVDSIFMSRLIHSAVQAVCSCGGVVAELTDENLDWMVLEVLKNPKIYSAGLLLTAIPQGIKNLYKSQLVSGGRK